VYETFIAMVSRNSSITMSMAQDFWNFSLEFCDEIAELKSKKSIDLCVKTIKSSVLGQEFIPDIKLNALVRKADGTTHLYKKLDVLPSGLLAVRNEVLLYTQHYVKLEDIAKFHLRSHQSLGRVASCNAVIVNQDGVPLTKSSNKTGEVTSVKFPNCSTIYHWSITCPYNGYKFLDNQSKDLVDPIVKAVKACDIHLSQVLNDAPKRAKFRGLKNHGGYYCCDYCEQKGIRKGRRGGPCWFPYTVRKATPRTDVRFREQVTKRFTKKNGFDGKGIMSKSPLLELPYFDMVNSIPCEWMHLVCTGKSM
jgi:hypothetical protein